ncbi:MAG: VWA domain-containing protein [Byssovorax sp.]
MKPTKLAVLTALGMLLTSVSVYSLTPPGGIAIGAAADGKPLGSAGTTVEELTTKLPDQPDATDQSRFSAGSTLMVEGRLGHPQLARGSQGETFVMLEVRGGEAQKARAVAPVNLALVIDRSGSMKGTRIRNAIKAATSAVERLNEGDTVSVVTFDTQVQVVVPPTTIAPGSRSQVVSQIQGIGLGGDTCISCGLEQAMSLLQQTAGKVDRMILLSDGDANHGVRDIPGFRSISQRAATRGASITTIGVDVGYNEKIMTALAQESNGRHYFVENDAALARVFEAEAESLTSTLASNTEVTLDLAPGVELDRVFDRSFRRSGNRVIVPLGAFTKDDVKTVLVKVKVPAQLEGKVPVAAVDLTYRDLLANNDGHCGGALALRVGGTGPSELDPVVNGRVQRTETASALKEANELFNQGKVTEARRKLEQQEKTLQTVADAARRAAPAAKAKQIDDDFSNQIAVLGQANSGFATPPAATATGFGGPVQGGFAQPPAVQAAPPPPPAPDSRAGKSAVKANEQRAFDLAF